MLVNDHLFGKKLFIRFTARAFRRLLSVYVFSYFPFGFEGRMWDLIASVPDHSLSFYLTVQEVVQESFSTGDPSALFTEYICLLAHPFETTAQSISRSRHQTGKGHKQLRHNQLKTAHSSR